MDIYYSYFGSCIGNLYYIFKENGKDSPKLAYLSNSKDSFKSYIKKLQKKHKNMTLSEMRSDKVEERILDYLSCSSRDIDLEPIFLTGNVFEKKVWNAALKIPYGMVSTYREIAESAGYPGAWRAAGSALGKNPIMLLVACHRVIRSDGRIGFYGGGEDVKEYLLGLESGPDVKIAGQNKENT